MSDVIFEEEKRKEEHISSSYGNTPSKEQSKMASFLIRKGIAKSTTNANIILVIFALAAFLISLYFWFS